MSEQDKEMEAAAVEYVGNDHSVAYDAFKVGWKAASERKDAEIERLTDDKNASAKRHNSSQLEIIDLQSKLATALAALEWYANDGHTGRPILAGNVAREAIALIKGDAK